MNTRSFTTMVFVLLTTMTFAVHAAKSVSTQDQSSMVPNIGSKPVTVADVKKAILGAAIDRGWQPMEDTGGKVRLQLDDKRKSEYRLIVDVVYDAKNYTIKYVSSTGLKYDEKGGTIH